VPADPTHEDIVMPANLIVAQSGGPTAVINSSLRGIVETALAFPDTFGRVYAARFGIEGVLREDLLDLTAQDPDELALLRCTPAAGSVGTSRYKLPESQREDMQRLLDVFRAQDVRYFLYIGGNGSMGTAHTLSRLAAERTLDLVVVGVPKTVDNDLGDPDFRLIDHTPGYGSAARYWMDLVQNAEQENAGSRTSDPVLVLQAMGRTAGFLPAAARLADPRREMPLQICLPEAPVTPDVLCDRVSDQLSRDGRCIVVVGEGFRVDDLGERRDSAGQTLFGSSRTTVAQQVVNLLNARGFSVPGHARGQVPGTDQRSCIARASVVDLDEAYRVGQKAVLLARDNRTGVMATLLREPGPVYAVRYDAVPLEHVAGSRRTLPPSWLDSNGTDVTDAFVRYARPLVGEDSPSVPLVDGRHRYARLRAVLAAKRLPDYVPEALRT